jgi:hypothetical protein
VHPTGDGPESGNPRHVPEVSVGVAEVAGVNPPRAIVGLPRLHVTALPARSKTRQAREALPGPLAAVALASVSLNVQRTDDRLP